MKSGFLNNMAPNAQRAFLMTMVFAGIATLLYMFAVLPTEDALQSATEARTTAEATKKRIQDNVTNAERRKKALEGMEQEYNDYKEQMLVEKLGNFSTHAQQILYPLAYGAGLRDISFNTREPSIRRMPLPDPKQTKLPAQLHARVGITLTAFGSFQRVASMLLQLERQQPLATVREMRIATQPNNDKEQKIEMMIEWPAAITEPKPPAGAKK